VLTLSCKTVRNVEGKVVRERMEKNIEFKDKLMHNRMRWCELFEE
jgi:hypothetical protein